MTGLRITVYGGAAGDDPDGEIGGNRILVETPERAWFCDFGTRFKLAGRYYEEFLKPRASTLGIRDFLRMGLLPPLEGIYREDLWAHESDLWHQYRDHPQHRRVDRLDGVLVSHGHLDHTGSIGFLRSDIPIYTGLVTATTGKAMEDTKGIGPENETNYIAPREVDGSLLKASKSPRFQRPHFICEDTDLEPLRTFWCNVPGVKTAMFACPLESWSNQPGLRFWRVDHSIPGSGAFGIDSPLGWVIYSGDLRRHGHSGDKVETFAQEARSLSPALLIVEGTHVRKGAPTSETTVHDAADDVVSKSEGLVIADFGPRNIERLRTFHDIAMARGRRLVVTVQDAYLLEALHLADPAIPSLDEECMAILRKPAGSEKNWAKELYDRYPSRTVDAEDIRSDQGGFILCLSFWDISALIDIEPSGGTYLYSSSEAYSEEQEIDQERLVNWLNHFGLRVVGGIPGGEEGPFHASGHADGPALESFISTVDPERILPVHTESLGWFTDRWPDRIVPAAEGRLLDLE